MNKESSIEAGRCQCGDITYTLDKNKVISAHHCHCKDCQRTTGSGKATILFIAKTVSYTHLTLPTIYSV